MTETRGERQNDPGNIDRTSIAWLGMARDQTDPRFVGFTEPIYGIRAIGKILLSYQRIHGCGTIAKLISRWAPQSENNTKAYIAAVSLESGINPDQPIDLTDAATLAKIITAIIHHENGEVIYSADLIAQAAGMALA
jgi:hypothetical protein